ncbi:MAG: hypothetical protein GC185_09690 [Alphaproteobacteria bacterium]|nr:hypothetical protein [Alphaproteobacteria bacterium]
MIRDVRKDAGFSLIELAILLTIVSLMVATGLQSFRQYSVTKQRNDTLAREDIITQSMIRFIYNFRRMPCPADPSLTPEDAQAGFEQCLDKPGQNAPFYCSGAVCRIDGGRHSPDNPSGGFQPDKALTGAVPYATLGIPLNETVDGWGTKFAYTVSEFLTVQGSGAAGSGTYNDDYGCIDIQKYDPATGLIAPIKEKYPDGSLRPNASYMMALVSYGENRKGGYGYGGNQISTCTGAGRDLENCDGDSTFLLRGNVVSKVQGPNYYDDAVVLYKLKLESDKWLYATTSGIKNKTGGSVGIGVDNPSSLLDVDGSIQLKDSGAASFMADTYCDDSGNCMPMANVMTSGMFCTDNVNGVVSSVADNKFTCPNKLQGAVANSCGAAEFVVGFDALGKPKCCPATGCP